MSTGYSLPNLALQVSFTTTPFATPAWVDITSYLRTVQWRRGRQHVLGNYEAGSLTAVLNGRDRALDPTNTGSIYAPNVDINKRLQLTAQWNLLSATQGAALPTAGWTAGTNTAVTYTAKGLTLTAEAAGTISANTSQALSGLGGYANAAYGSALYGGAGVATSGPVYERATAGRIYTGMALYTAATTGRNVTTTLTFYNASLTVLGTFTSAGTADNNASATLDSLSATAPSGTVWVGQTVNVTGALAAEVHYISQPGIFPADNVTVWDAGGPVTLFTGFVDAWTPKWPDSVNADIELTATDGLRLLSQTKLLSSVYQSTVLADGATHLWRMNDATGSLAVDIGSAASATTNGTYQSAVTLGEAGPIINDPSTSAYFDYALPAYGYVSANTPGVGTSPWSLELWFLSPTGQGTSNSNRPFMYWSGDYTVTNTTGHYAYVLQRAITAPTDYPIVLVWGGGIAGGTPQTHVYWGVQGIDLADGKWHHAVATNTTGSNVTTYLDGVNYGTNVYPFDPIPSSFLNWGNTPALQGSTTDYQGKVTMANCALYAGVLTPAQIADHYQKGLRAWPIQDSGARMTAVLNSVSWPAADRSIATGQSTLQLPTQSSVTGSDAKTYGDLVALSERGAFYADGSGKITFLNRYAGISAPGNVSMGTFGDGGGAEIPYKVAPSIALDNLDLYNQVVAQTLQAPTVNQVSAPTVSGILQSAEDTVSEAKYGTKITLSLTGLLNANDADMLSRAQYEVAHFAYPVVRIGGFTVDPGGEPGTRYPQVLRRELTDRITVKRRPPGGGPVFSQDGYIEHLENVVDAAAGTWEWTVATSPADTQTYWILGDATLGVLGTTTRLAW